MDLIDEVVRWRYWLVDPTPAVGPLWLKPFGAHDTTVWRRASSAVVEELFVPEVMGSVAARLGETYGVPCGVGFPSVFPAWEWAERTTLGWVDEEHTLRYPTHEELGLRPASAVRPQ